MANDASEGGRGGRAVGRGGRMQWAASSRQGALSTPGKRTLTAALARAAGADTAAEASSAQPAPPAVDHMAQELHAVARRHDVEASELLTALGDGDAPLQSIGEVSGQEGRNLAFEELKNEMQKLSQMQQALSAVLNKMDESAMNAIRKI